MERQVDFPRTYLTLFYLICSPIPSLLFLVACYATLHPALSVRRSVGPSVGHTLLFLGFWGFWHHCSCPNDLVTSIMAPAHPHATGVAVFPALFFFRLEAATARGSSITILSPSFKFFLIHYFYLYHSCFHYFSYT